MRQGDREAASNHPRTIAAEKLVVYSYKSTSANGLGHLTRIGILPRAEESDTYDNARQRMVRTTNDVHRLLPLIGTHNFDRLPID